MEEKGEIFRPFSVVDEESCLLDAPKKRFSPQNETIQENHSISSFLRNLLFSAPAVILLAVYNGTMSVPFGSSYFSQTVPLGEAERQALGMRMSFLALVVGQFVMGMPGTTTLSLVTVWQLGELAPFYHTFADFAASRYETDSILPTTLYLMSMSTMVIGISFCIVGKLGAGKLLSFIPTYSILGFVAGIGVWCVGMSLSVSSSPAKGADDAREVSGGILGLPFLLSVACTAGIRILRYLIPREKFMLLDPTYFLSIPIVFYLGLWALGMNYNQAVNLGLLFRNPNEESISFSFKSTIHQVLRIWTSFDVSKVHWSAVFHVAPEILACAVLAILLVCPFIPPLSIFLGQEIDFSMDREFMAHGYSNFLSSILSPGGLAMCLCYSTTVIFSNAGAKGAGRSSMIFLAIANFAVFVYGPIVVEYIPRCLAGALLLDMGIALFLEGVLDYKKFDAFEYASIWAVMIIMNVIDMTAGLMTGLITALITFAIQASSSPTERGGPIRRAMDASNLPSGRWRSPKAAEILDDPIHGRARIAVFQLQGHIFFGNAPALQEQVIAFLQKRLDEDSDNVDEFSMVVLDFTLVVGIDASAAATIDKLQDVMKKKLDVTTVVSVAPFSNEDDLLSIRSELPGVNTSSVRMSVVKEEAGITCSSSRTTENLRGDDTLRQSTLVTRGDFDQSIPVHIDGEFYDTLDEALSTCEDILLRQRTPGIERLFSESLKDVRRGRDEKQFGKSEAILALKNYLCEEDESLLEEIYARLERRTTPNGAILIAAGDITDNVYLLVHGSFIAHRYVRQEMDMHWKHNIDTGVFIGLPSMILHEKQLMTVRCMSYDAVVYALSRTSYDALVEKSPKVARILDVALARTLSVSLHILSNRLYT